MTARSHRPSTLLLIAFTAAGAGCILDTDPPNAPPVIDALSADQIQVAPDSSATVTVAAHDPEGAPLDYRWTATGGRFESGSYEASAVWRAPSAQGPCTLSVSVDDDRDAVAGSVVVIVTNEPGTPVLVIDAPRRAFGLTGERLPVRLKNTSDVPAAWTAAADADWAAPAPAAGVLAPAAADTIWLEADRGAVPPGAHEVRLTLAWGDNVDVVLFTLLQPWTYEIVARHPHDPEAFTQGLLWHDGSLYESTGRYGRSTLREVDPETGAVVRERALGEGYFAEGLALWQGRLLQLTWLEHTAFVWALDDFAPLDTFAYPTQGWGLTHDGERLIMSDGSSTLYFRDPETFAETGRVTVQAWGEELSELNELEWIDGVVWANVWLTDLVVRIDPGSGSVIDVVDLSGLLTPGEAAAANILNGIAHDPDTGRTWVTGKLWPWLFEIALVDPSTR